MSLSAYERGYRFGQRARNTVFLTVLAWFIGAGSTFWWHVEVFTLLLAPADELLSPFGGLPTYSAPQDPFTSTLKLSAMGGSVVAFPIVAVGLLSMLKPFVTRRFWLFLTTYSTLAIASFVTGAAFVYFVMMPVSLHFLLTFGEGFAVPVILLTEYMALLIALLVWIGIAFELPIIMNLLAKFRLIKYPRARSLRKWVPWFALIFAALITPSLDGTLTFMVAAPVMLLYEFGLIAGWLEHPSEGSYPKDLYNDIKSLVLVVLIAVLGMVVEVIALAARLTGLKWAYRKAYYAVRRHGLGFWWD